MLIKQCRICSPNFPAYDAYLLPRPYSETAIEYYHHCHSLLKAGRLYEAGLFAQLTIVASKDTVNNPVYVNTFFLQAKLTHQKNDFEFAIQQYEQFIAFGAIDPVLAADVYISLTTIYLVKQDWMKADYYLKSWFSNYFPFTGFKTKERLYDSVASIFLKPKAMSNPEMAIQLGTGFFTAIKDTVRLTDLYFHIADWYALRSPDMAITYLRKAIDASVASNNFAQQQRGYLNLSLVEEKRGRLSEALHYRKQYETVQEHEMTLSNSSPHTQLKFPATGKELVQGSPSYWKQRLMVVSALLIMLLIVFIVSFKAIKNRLLISKLRSEIETLKEVNKSKDQLLSIVSHDLRSAVHTLQINISHLKMLLSQLMTKAAIEVAEQTERLIGTVQSLLNNLLYWALNQTGQLSHYPEVIALKPLIAGICYDFSPMVTYKNITLDHTNTEGLYCSGDENSIKIIFRNLVDNAIKYTPANGSVIISTEKQAGFCNITIQDTGNGMDQEVIDALFTGSSWRIQQDASGRRSTGIGLWLARLMAERNGGTLSILSAKGRGTAVTVRLPLPTSEIH